MYNIFSIEITRKLIPKIQWDGLLSAVKNLALFEVDDLEKPNDTDSQEIQESFLRKLHHLLFEVHVMQGFLVCPESGRRFPIVDGKIIIIMN